MSLTATLTRSSASSDIAIIGMAGRFPGASTIKDFWSMLMSGKTGITNTPSDETAEDNWVNRCAPVDGDPAMFDAEFFGISEREAVLLDPQHRYLLEVAWEALENAGHDAAAGREDLRVGVFTASSPSSYMVEDLREAQLWSGEGVDYPVLLGNDKDFTASRISYQLDLHGPSVVAQSACSSSLTCVHLARRALQAGDCDIAIVGGASLGVDRNGYRFQPGGIMSPDGACRPFDAEAQGTIRGEGAAAVVLRRAEDAARDGDQVIAVICGSAVTNDGRRKAGFTAPGVLGQSRAIQEAMQEAGIDAGALGYVETHGTGTAIGDPIELRSLQAGHEKTGRLPSGCRLGAVKANVGHLDAAAGITGLIKAALVLQQQAVPGQPHFTRPCAALEWLSDHYVMSADALHDAQIRFAAVSSFGMGGTNAHAVLKAPPAQPRAIADVGQMHRFEVSARDDESLQARLRAIATWIEDEAPHPWDVCKTLSEARRYPVSQSMVGTLNQFVDWCRGGAKADSDAHTPDCFHDTAVRVAVPGHPRRPKRFWPDSDTAPGVMAPAGVAKSDTRTAEAPHQDGPSWTAQDLVDHVSHFMQVPTVSNDADLVELGMDSVDMLQLLGELEDRFGISVPLPNFMADPTVACLLGEETPPEGARPEATPTPLPQPEGVVAPNTETARLPSVKAVWHTVRIGDTRNLVMIHPAGGTTGCYVPLAQRSRAGWTWHAIASSAATDLSIREMAADYAQLIIDKRLEGDIVLGGYSMGGNVAVEVAYQLSVRGIHVPRLLLLDSYPPEVYLAPRHPADALDAFSRLVPSAFPRLAGATAPMNPTSVRDVIERMASEVGVDMPTDTNIAQAEQFYQAWTHHHEALERWVPEHPLDIPFTLIRATSNDHDILRLMDIRPGDGWDWQRHTTRPLTIVDTDGNHFSLVEDQRHLDTLAEGLDLFLESALAEVAHHD